MTVAIHEGSSLAIRQDQDFWTERQLATLRQVGVEDASKGDLAVFFHQSQRTGLDPFARQIYMVGRWDSRSRSTKYTIQTGIDGFRLIGRRAADARHETLEVSDTEWCGADGRWMDVWLKQEPPAAARVAIIRNGGRFPAVALFREYAQYTKDGNLTKMWADKGALMIAKCAEALAWRKAFPQDLSGLYTSDEMGATDNPAQHTPARQTPAEPVAEASDSRTPAQARKLAVVMKEAGLDNRDEALAYFQGIIGREIASTKELTKSECSKIIDQLSEANNAGVDVQTGEIVEDAEVVEAAPAPVVAANVDPWAEPQR